jgi:hypothetical protein
MLVIASGSSFRSKNLQALLKKRTAFNDSIDNE